MHKRGPRLDEGKTKIIYRDPDFPDTFVLIESKDDVTAGDGERRDIIPDKGHLSTITAANCR